MQVQAAPLQRVAQVAHVVGGQQHHRRHLRVDDADLRNRDLVGGQHLQQERLERLVRLVDLVDQQHAPPCCCSARSSGRGSRNGSEKNMSPMPAACPARPAACRRAPMHVAHLVLQDLGVEQLLAVLPLVQRLGLVQALVALHADQRQVEQAAADFASSVLPTPAGPSTRIGFCSAGPDRRRSRSAGGDVADRRQALFHRLDRRKSARGRLGQRRSCVWHRGSNRECYPWVAFSSRLPKGGVGLSLRSIHKGRQRHGLPHQPGAAGHGRFGARPGAVRIQGECRQVDGRHVPLGEHEASSPHSACSACRCRRNTAASACRSWTPR